MAVDQSVNALLDQAEQYLKAKNRAEAVPVLQQALHLDPNNVRALCYTSLIITDPGAKARLHDRLAPLSPTTPQEAQLKARAMQLLAVPSVPSTPPAPPPQPQQIPIAAPPPAAPESNPRPTPPPQPKTAQSGGIGRFLPFLVAGGGVLIVGIVIIALLGGAGAPSAAPDTANNGGANPSTAAPSGSAQNTPQAANPTPPPPDQPVVNTEPTTPPKPKSLLMLTIWRGGEDATSELAFLSPDTDTIYAMPIDPDYFGTFMNIPDISPTTGVVAFSGGLQGSGVGLISQLRNGRFEPETKYTVVVWTDLVWAPDGRNIVLTGYDRPDNYTAGDLYLYDSITKKLTNLTDTPNDTETAPVWSPDGKQIAFNITGSKVNILQRIGIMNADGSNRRIITPKDVGHQNPVWSPDGKTLLASRGAVRTGAIQRITGGDTVIMDTNGAIVQVVSARPSGRGALWTPDGSGVVLHSDDDLLYYIKRDGSGERLIHPEKADTPDGPYNRWRDRDFQFSISPDGRQVAFIGGRRVIIAPLDGQGQPIEYTARWYTKSVQWVKDPDAVIPHFSNMKPNVASGMPTSAPIVLSADQFASREGELAFPSSCDLGRTPGGLFGAFTFFCRITHKGLPTEVTALLAWGTNTAGSDLGGGLGRGLGTVTLGGRTTRAYGEAIFSISYLRYLKALAGPGQYAISVTVRNGKTPATVLLTSDQPDIYTNENAVRLAAGLVYAVAGFDLGTVAPASTPVGLPRPTQAPTPLPTATTDLGIRQRAPVDTVVLTKETIASEGRMQFSAKGRPIQDPTSILIDTTAFKSGYLIVQLTVGSGEAAASVDLYPEGVPITLQGVPTGNIAATYDLRPGRKDTLAIKFTKGQVFTLTATGSWLSKTGATNTVYYRVNVSNGR